MTLSLGHLVGHNTIELVYRTRMCVFPPASHNITSKINLLPSPPSDPLNSSLESNLSMLSIVLQQWCALYCIQRIFVSTVHLYCIWTEFVYCICMFFMPSSEPHLNNPLEKEKWACSFTSAHPLPPTVTHSNTIPQPCMPLLRYFISAIIVGMVCCGLLMHAYHHNSILVCISSFAQLLSCFEVFLPL